MFIVQIGMRMHDKCDFSVLCTTQISATGSQHWLNFSAANKCRNMYVLKNDKTISHFIIPIFLQAYSV